MGKERPTVAIVGGGASGVIVALHLLGLPPDGLGRVTIFERSGKLGAGAAFSTTYDSHLLNVPACGMSALAAEPDHFVQWARRQRLPASPRSFLPRKLYRAYLRETLESAGSSSGHRLDVIADQVVDIVPQGQGANVIAARRRPLHADVVILAPGVVSPELPTNLVKPAAASRFITNPWEPGALLDIEASATVTVLGTGLTAVDTLLALREHGHGGPVHAISRHGLLPQAHVYPPEPCSEHPDYSRLVGAEQASVLVHQVRAAARGAEQAGGDWRDVVDALRPRAQALWLGLEPQEQARFRRHVERFWNVHRHRMAPEVGQEVERLRDEGVFTVHAGRVDSVEASARALVVDVHQAGSRRPRRWQSDWVVNCTGPGTNAFRPDQQLFNRLAERGLAVPGPLGMGVATDLDGRVTGPAGQAIGWMWAIGSLRQGQLFESTAVPEIRLQAQAIAHQLAQLVPGALTIDLGERVPVGALPD